jgi:hypothetical protein
MSSVGVCVIAVGLAVLTGLPTLEYWPRKVSSVEIGILLLIALYLGLILIVQSFGAKRHSQPFLAFMKSTLNATTE